MVTITAQDRLISRGDRWRTLESWGAPATTTVGLLLWALSVDEIEPYRSTAIGLVGQLPVAWWTGLVLVVAGFALEAIRPRPRAASLCFSVAALALVLHGTAPAAESTGRFPVSYTTAGFADYIGRTGRSLTHFDARFSWPGLFSAVGMAARAMDVPTTWFIRWAPLIFNLAYLLPVKAIANGNLRTERARWAALWLFLVGDWIGQDYFSPQALNFFLYLTIMAVVLRFFVTSEHWPRSVQGLLRRPLIRSAGHTAATILRVEPDAPAGEDLSIRSTHRMKLALFGLVLLALSASVVSHQLTPVALSLSLLGLAVLGRTQLRTLWLLSLALIFAWLSWEAEAYWNGHLSAIFGNVGHVGGTVNSNVGLRLQGNVSTARKIVLDARFVSAFVAVVTSWFALWWMWRRGRTHWNLGVLLLAPALLLAGQSYGGEAILRVFLFSLPAVSVLIAGLIDSDDFALARRRSYRPHSGSARYDWSGVRVFAVTAVVLLGLFPLTRWGNESFEAVAPQDLQLAQWAVHHIPHGSTILLPVIDSPIQYSGIGYFNYADMGSLDQMPVPALGAALLTLGPKPWIVITKSQYEYGLVASGLPVGWTTSLAQRLLATGEVAVRNRTGTGLVLQVVPKGTGG